MPDTPTNPADAFTGLIGSWKQIAAFGVTGVVCAMLAYQSLIIVPKMHEDHNTHIKDYVEGSRTEADKSREHGNTAAKAMSDAIREQTQEISKNQRELIWYQKQTIANLPDRPPMKESK